MSENLIEREINELYSRLTPQFIETENTLSLDETINYGCLNNQLQTKFSDSLCKNTSTVWSSSIK